MPSDKPSYTYEIRVLGDPTNLTLSVTTPVSPSELLKIFDCRHDPSLTLNEMRTLKNLPPLSSDDPFSMNLEAPIVDLTYNKSMLEK